MPKLPRKSSNLERGPDDGITPSPDLHANSSSTGEGPIKGEEPLDEVASEITEEVREVLTALEALYRPGQVVELRVPGYPQGNGTTAGYFDDLAELALQALKLDGKAPGIYVTLNEINPALVARIRNRTERWVKQTTSDGDVIRRRWLPLDFDPVKPSGIPSTDAEHSAALERAAACRHHLKERGWPDPIEADSGNGAHLLYPIDLPNDEPARVLIETCLKALAARFGDAVVNVDTKVGNAARIWKLYGTIAAKGDGTEDRPHRRSRLLYVPEKSKAVTVEQLEELAAESGDDPLSREAPSTQGDGPRLDVGRWLEARGIEYRTKPPKAPDDRTVYRMTCPFNSDHADAAVMQDPAGKLSAKCFHNSCQGKGWAQFKEKIGAPDRDHYDPPLLPAGPAGGGNTVIKIIPVVPPELGEAAYYGFVGQFLRAVAPFTEATDAGVLAHLLPAVGTLAGPGLYVWAGNRQSARVNTILVGPSNAGRKGTSCAPVDLLFQLVAPEFWKRQRVSGLSSGEGLIAYLSDEVGKDEEGNKVIIHTEKRLYVVEDEFSRVLANISREGNTLSETVRSAFDSGNLANLTVNSRQAPGTHVSITGHITPEELANRLGPVEMANGFGNRFQWFVVKSDKVMPHTRPIPKEVFKPFVEYLRCLYRVGSVPKADHPVEFDADAAAMWEKVYPTLREDKPGLAGAMVARGSAIVLRLALIYALLDCKPRKSLLVPLDLKSLAVRVEHLEAALAVWRYCEESARMLFGSKTGDPLADKLLALLARGPMTKNEFNTHLSEKQKRGVSAALAKLEAAGLARKTRVTHEGAGRPAERWELVDKRSR